MRQRWIVFVAAIAGMEAVVGGCAAPAARAPTGGVEVAPARAAPTDVAGQGSDAVAPASPDVPRLAVDPAIEPVSVADPPASAARAFDVCLVREWVARMGLEVIAGMGRVEHASDAVHYARLTRRNTELQSDDPAWIIQFRGDLRLPGDDRIFVDPTCIVVDGGDGGFFGTGGVRMPGSDAVSTPLPDAVSPDRALPPPNP